MSENSRPWNGTTVGDAGPYSDGNWQEVWRNIVGWGGERANVGVFLSSGTQPDDGLRVQEQSPAAAAIDVLRGAALVRGVFYYNDATEAFTIAANSSGNPRIDTLMLRLDYALQTVRLALKQGTPAATPVPPALTQSAGIMWEIPVADIAAADSFTSITQANITQRQEWVNAPPGVYLDSVVNNSGATLEDGDVVVWDISADRAVTTTTTANNRLLAGVWRGRTANGESGRVQTDGIGLVRVSAAVARGDQLATSTTARAAAAATRINASLGLVLETLGAAGLVLANIRIQRRTAPPFAVLEDQKAQNTAGGTSVAATWTTRDLNTEVADANSIVSIAANAFTPIAGVYRIHINSPFVNSATLSSSVRIRLFNVTQASVVQVSSNYAILPASDGGNVILATSIVANGTDAYAVQYYITNARLTNGLGIGVNEAGAVERYTQVFLEKIG